MTTKPQNPVLPLCQSAFLIGWNWSITVYTMLFQLKKIFKNKKLYRIHFEREREKSVDVCQLQACPMQVVIKKMQNCQNKQKKNPLHISMESPVHSWWMRFEQSIHCCCCFPSRLRRKETKRRKREKRRERENRPTPTLFSFLHFSIYNINVCATLFLIIILFFSPFFPPRYFYSVCRSMMSHSHK